MKHNEVKIGDHCWTILNNKLLIVLKISDSTYEVCGGLNSSVNIDKFNTISIIEKPEGYEDTELYYS